MTNEMRKKNRRRGKVGRRLLSVLMALTLFISAFSGIVFFHYSPEVARAANGISIKITGGETLLETESNTITARELPLELVSDSISFTNENDYRVDWAIESGEGTVINMLAGSNIFHKKLVSLAPGEASISATVYDKKNGETWVGSVSCAFTVEFAVDTTNTSIFKKVYTSDTKKSLVMYTNTATQQMELNFGNANKAQWEIDNEEVATVGRNTGKVTPKGAGCTLMTASYTPDDNPDKTYTATIKVYVVPMAKGALDTTYKTGPSISLNSGDTFDVDTYLTANSPDGIKNRICWSIRQEDGSGAIRSY